MGKKAKAAYTPEQIALLKKVVIDYTPKQLAALEKKHPAETPEQCAKLNEDRKFIEDCIAVRDGQRPPPWAETLHAKPQSERSKSESKPAEKTRKAYWEDAVDRAFRENFPDDTATNFKPKEVVKTIHNALESEIRESGRKPPTRSLILRKSGHWKT